MKKSQFLLLHKELKQDINFIKQLISTIRMNGYSPMYLIDLFEYTRESGDFRNCLNLFKTMENISKAGHRLNDKELIFIKMIVSQYGIDNNMFNKIRNISLSLYNENSTDSKLEEIAKYVGHKFPDMICKVENNSVIIEKYDIVKEWNKMSVLLDTTEFKKLPNNSIIISIEKALEKFKLRRVITIHERHTIKLVLVDNRNNYYFCDSTYNLIKLSRIDDVKQVEQVEQFIKSF
jgi:hypothetical protein